MAFDPQPPEPSDGWEFGASALTSPEVRTAHWLSEQAADYFDRHIERLILGTSITRRLKDADGNWVE